MNKEELDYIAQTIFEKILEKQVEYDKQFKDDLEDMFIENVNEMTAETKRDHLMGELARLHTLLQSHIEQEDYERASVLKRKIDLIEDKLKNL